jgi:hypothetical protein
LADGLRNHEIAAALVENERALRSLAIAAHRGFILLEENGRTVSAQVKAILDLERQVAAMRGEVQTLIAVHQTLVDLRKEELALERDKVERETTGEIMRAESEAETRRKFVETFGKLFTTRGGLLLCGGMIGASVFTIALLLLGPDTTLSLMSGLLALTKGFR